MISGLMFILNLPIKMSTRFFARFEITNVMHDTYKIAQTIISGRINLGEIVMAFPPALSYEECA